MSPRHRKPYSSWDSDAEAREQPQICPTTGKRKYADESEANATARHQMSRVRAVLAARREKSESEDVQLRTYKCLYCGAWHLTSKKA